MLAEGLAQKKNMGKVDREKSKLEHELAESRSKASLLEARVANLNKLVDQLETKANERNAELEKMARERD